MGSNWIGAFLVANNKYLLHPHGTEKDLLDKLKEHFKVFVPASINQSKLLGPYIAMNNNGILLPKIAYDDEIENIKKQVGDSIQISVVDSRNNTLGNMILCNDKGAIISHLLKSHQSLIRDVLNVEVSVFEFGGNELPGSNGIANNVGCCIHPLSTDRDVEIISDLLKVDVDVSTINRGVAFLKYGAVANDNMGIFSNISTGPEMQRLTNVLML